MFIVSLIAEREAKLEPELVRSLQGAWGGTSANWLAVDEAAEFAVGQKPGNFRDVWEDLQGVRVDLNILEEQGRRKKVLLADMDSTMIRQECIDELAEEAGVGARVVEITRKAMNGEIGFEGALRERVGLLRGLKSAVIEKVWKERIDLMPGGAELVAVMRGEGAYAALVSGGFTQFTHRVAERLGFDEHRANVLIEEDGKLTGEVGEPILGKDAKVAALEDVTRKLGIREADVLAVGDGANDLGMLKRAGMGVALHAKPSVQEDCELRINHGDLTALAYLQGYGRAELAGAHQA